MPVEKLFRPDLAGLAGYPQSASMHESVLRLHCNENPWAPSSSSHPRINRYPEQQPGELRERMAAHFAVDPASLLVTRGADDAIDLLIRGFCRPGGDAIVQCPPAFVMYAFSARLHGVPVSSVQLIPPDFEVDAAGIRNRVAHGARIVFLCSPNNPTGSLVPAALIEQLARELAGRALLVVDEAYIEFSGQQSVASCIGKEQYSSLVVLRTLSKAGSIAGARIGALIARPDVVEYLLRAVVSPFPLATPAVEEAMRALSPESQSAATQRISQSVEQRERLAARLVRYPFTRQVYPSHANFLLVEVDDARGLDAWCRQHGVLVRDQSSQPGLGSHLRISAGTRGEMDRLFTVLDQYSSREQS